MLLGRMCREAIPLAGRFGLRKVLPEGTGIAQVVFYSPLLYRVPAAQSIVCDSESGQFCSDALLTFRMG